VFCVVLVPTASIMLALAIAEQFLDRGFGLQLSVSSLCYLWPLPVRFAIVCACIFAACNVFGRMAADNELLAIQGAGVSLLKLIWPVVGLAIPLSFVCVWLEDLALTWGHEHVQRCVLQSAGDIVYQALRSRRTYRTNQFEIIVKGIDGNRLIQPVVTFLANDERGAIIGADEGFLETGFPEPILQLSVQSGYLRTPSGLQIEFTDQWTQAIPLEIKRGDAFDLRRIREQQQEVIQLRQKLAAARVHSHADRGESTTRVALERELSQCERWLERLEARFQKKWSSAFCCLFGTILSIPVAILLRTHGINSFFLCFLPILLLYEPLTMLCYELAKAGRVSEYIIWSGNAVMGVLGGQLMWRVRRH
jgi:lipopolysaccharide export system permease protein